MKFMNLLRGAAAAALLSMAGAASAQTVELKLAHHVTPMHAMSKFLETWAADLAKASDGRIKIDIFPSQQMGPGNRNYEMTRTGVADITWMLHGLTAKQFPLTGLIDLPFMVGSAEIGTKVLNDPDLKDLFLAGEHQGVKPLWLFTHQPGNLNMADTPVANVTDLKGKRIRFPSAAIRDYTVALGATPQAVPPTAMFDSLQKGIIDGVFIDWGGAGLAFKLGPQIKYTTELYAYVASMCICMNQASYDAMPDDLKTIFDASLVGREKEIGALWDAQDPIGKTAMLEAGTQVVELTPEARAEFVEIGKAVATERVKELDAQGLPASAVYAKMRELSEKYSQDSFSFWK